MNYETLKRQCSVWQDYIEHPFLMQLAAGHLPLSAFQYYLQQDYLFLQQFTRAWGLAIYKSRSPHEMRIAQSSINALLDYELNLHIQFCAGYGISESQLLQLEEDPANIAYTRYVLDTGHSGTLVELYAALVPCVCGYAEIGKRLARQSTRNHLYQQWIDTYAAAEFQEFATRLITEFDLLLQETSNAQQQRLQQIFNTATRMEVNFWQMGLNH